MLNKLIDEALRKGELWIMRKSIISLVILSLPACSVFERKLQDCAWSNAEKELAWENTKRELLKTDAEAKDFYYLSKPASELRFLSEKAYCTLIPPINPRPKRAYLDGGVFVYLDKGNQSVIKIEPIAW